MGKIVDVGAIGGDVEFLRTSSVDSGQRYSPPAPAGGGYEEDNPVPASLYPQLGSSQGLPSAARIPSQNADFKSSYSPCGKSNSMAGVFQTIKDTEALGDAGVTDHGLLSGLADDDHSQYFYLPGRPGGQIGYGGIGRADNLILRSTLHVTKGYVEVGPSEELRVDNYLLVKSASEQPSIEILNWSDANLDPAIFFSLGATPLKRFINGLGESFDDDWFLGYGSQISETVAAETYSGGVQAFNGEILVVDSGNHRVKKHLIDSGVMTFLDEVGSNGSGDGQFSSPDGICQDGTYFYVCDNQNHRIQKFVTATMAFDSKIGSVGAGNDQFNSPAGITTDGTYLYICDTGNNRVVKRLCSTLAYDSEVGALIPRGCHHDGTNLYVVSGFSSYEIYKINPIAMTVTSQVDISSPAINAAACFSDGTYLYVSVYNTSVSLNSIRKYNCLDLTYDSQFYNSGPGSYEACKAVVKDDDNFYIAEYRSTTVNQISAIDDVTETWLWSAGTYGSGDDNFYVIGYGGLALVTESLPLTPLGTKRGPILRARYSTYMFDIYPDCSMHAEVRFLENSVANVNYVSLQSPVAITASYNLTWPGTGPAADGHFSINAAGEISWGQSLASTAGPTFDHIHITSTAVVTNLNADMVDGLHAASFAPSTHSVLSATHGDTTAAAVVRGDIIIGSGVVPAWTRLAKGTSGWVLTMGADEPAWAALPPATSKLLSATHTDTVAADPVLGDIIYGDATPNWTKLAGNVAAAKQYLSQTGNGAISAIPAWAAIAQADVTGLTIADGPSFDHIHLTVAIGTAPMVVTSTNVVTNLNADTVDARHETEFALLAGRAGGQTLVGDTAASGNLTLQSTAHATRGNIYFGPNTYYKEIGSSYYQNILEAQTVINGIDITRFPSVLQTIAATGTNETMDNLWEAYKFVPSAAHVLGSFVVFMRRVGTITNVTQTIQGYIYSDNAGVPGASVGGIGLTRYGYLTTSYASLYFDMVGTTLIADGRSYWVVIRMGAAPAGGGTIQIERDSTVGAASWAFSATGGAASWTTENDKRMRVIFYADSSKGINLSTVETCATFASYFGYGMTISALWGTAAMSVTSQNSKGIIVTAPFDTGITVASQATGIDIAITGAGSPGVSAVVVGGRAFSGTATTGTVIGGTSDSGFGVLVSSTSGIGIDITVQTGLTGRFIFNPVATNTFLDVIEIKRFTSGTAAIGIGSGVAFYSENSVGTEKKIGRLGFVMTNVTNPNEEGAFVVYNMNAGAVAREVFRVDTLMNVGIGLTAWGASAQKVLGIANGVAPAVLANAVQIWSADYAAGDARCYILGEAGYPMNIGYQEIVGGDQSGGSLTLRSTSHGTKGYVYSDSYIRATTSRYRRYYHLPLSSANAHAGGATWVNPGANHTGGWQITNAAHTLYGQSDVHADWDGATDLKLEVRWCLGAAGAAPGDTVDLRAVIYYKGIGDTVTKTQTVEVATIVNASAQYTTFETIFTIDWDYAANVIDVGDIIGILLNLETDTSEVDNIIVTDMSFSYKTAHTYVEDGDE